MKKILSLCLALVLVLTMLAGAALAENSADEHTIEMKEVPVYMGEEEMGGEPDPLLPGRGIRPALHRGRRLA